MGREGVGQRCRSGERTRGFGGARREMRVNELRAESPQGSCKLRRIITGNGFEAVFYHDRVAQVIGGTTARQYLHLHVAAAQLGDLVGDEGLRKFGEDVNHVSDAPYAGTVHRRPSMISVTRPALPSQVYCVKIVWVAMAPRRSCKEGLNNSR